MAEHLVYFTAYVFRIISFCFLSCILFYVACAFVICLIKYLLTHLLGQMSSTRKNISVKQSIVLRRYSRRSTAHGRCIFTITVLHTSGELGYPSLWVPWVTDHDLWPILPTIVYILSSLGKCCITYQSLRMWLGQVFVVKSLSKGSLCTTKGAKIFKW